MHVFRNYVFVYSGTITLPKIPIPPPYIPIKETSSTLTRQARTPKTSCAPPGCPALSHDRYCEKHRRKTSRRTDRVRGTSAACGYGSRWRKARVAYLKAHPTCVECSKDERFTAATMVDHIVPHRGDARLFWDRSNWQALCAECHCRKMAREDGGFGNRTRGEGHRNP